MTRSFGFNKRRSFALSCTKRTLVQMLYDRRTIRAIKIRTDWKIKSFSWGGRGRLDWRIIRCAGTQTLSVHLCRRSSGGHHRLVEQLGPFCAQPQQRRHFLYRRGGVGHGDQYPLVGWHIGPRPSDPVKFRFTRPLAWAESISGEFGRTTPPG